MRTLMLIGNTKLTWYRRARNILEVALSKAAIQPKSRVLHERQFVYKKFLGRFLVRSSFSKISEDCGMFSNFIADFSKPGKPFFVTSMLILF
jgi:hypothetical protein